jgi:hypothetical protein
MVVVEFQRLVVAKDLGMVTNEIFLAFLTSGEFVGSPVGV